MEEWRQIPWLRPCYLASSLGKIKGPRGLLSLFPHGSGYLCCQADKSQWKVHRLICAAFYGLPPTAKHQAAHKDGNRHNNIPSNLYWATAAENCADTARHGSLRGINHPLARLCEADVLAIRRRRKDGESVTFILKSFPGLSYGTISAVCTRRNWSHI